MSLEELQKEIEEIKARNKRVEIDKAWETSWTRRLIVLLLTYIVVVIFFFVAELPDPFTNAVVPSVAFVVSTLTIPIFKQWWINGIPTAISPLIISTTSFFLGRNRTSRHDVRYSTMKEAEEIEMLRNKPSFNYTFDQATIESLKKHFDLEDSLYLIGTHNGIFAGFCSIDRNWWEDNHFFIREILVAPDFQKQNIGSELMGRCIKHAKQKGAKGIVTETAFENKPMQKLCEKFGFQKWNNPQWKEGITYKLVFSIVDREI